MLITAVAHLGAMPAYVAGLLVCGFVVVFGFRQCWRSLKLRIRGRVATTVQGPGVWAEFEVPGHGVFTCFTSTHASTGEEVEVLYDPGNPRNNELRSEASGWPMVVSLFVISSGATVVCAALITNMVG